MQYHTTDGNGVTEINPSPEKIRIILDSVDNPDMDYPDVSLFTEKGWSLTYCESGILLLENLNASDQIRYLRNCDRETVLALWLALVDDDFNALEGHAWSVD